jgi:hypothetical protein
VGTAVAQWLSYCATNQKVAGSIREGVMQFLSFESRESVFENNHRHYVSVLNTYLSTLYSRFCTEKKLNTTTKSNTRITLRIRNL